MSNKKHLLKSNTSSKFDIISDYELSKRLDLAQENKYLNRKHILLEKGISNRVISHHLVKVMPMRTRSMARQDKNNGECEDNIKIDHFYDETAEISQFEKISSKDAEFTDLVEKLDESLNVSKSTLQQLYRELNKNIPSNSKLSLENIKINQELDGNCQLVKEYLQCKNNNDRLIVLKNFTLSDKCWEMALRNEQFKYIHDVLYFFANDQQLIVLPIVLRMIAIAIFHGGLHHTHPGSQATIVKLKGVYWWPEIDDDVKYFIKYCKLCQMIKHTISQKSLCQMHQDK